MSKFRQSWWKASRFSPYNLVLKVAGAFDKLCQPLLFLFTDYCKQLGNRRGTTPGHIEGILRLFTPKSPHQTFCILILPGVFRIQLHPFPVLFLAAFVYQLSKPSCQNAFEARQIIPICFCVYHSIVKHLMHRIISCKNRLIQILLFSGQLPQKLRRSDKGSLIIGRAPGIDLSIALDVIRNCSVPLAERI